MLWPKLEFRDGEDATAIKTRFAKLRVQFPTKGPFWAASEAFKGLPYAIERGGAAATLWEQDAEVCEMRERIRTQIDDDNQLDTPEKVHRAIVAVVRDPTIGFQERNSLVKAYELILKSMGALDGDPATKKQPGAGNGLPTITIAAYPDDANTSDQAAA